MERYELELIEKYSVSNEVLAALYKEHLDFERELEKYNNKPFLTPNDEVERKNLQKKKLLGRDRIEEILQDLRRCERI